MTPAGNPQFENPDELRMAVASVTPSSLIDMARDSHILLTEADAAVKGHSAIRNAALMRLHQVYGLDTATIADACGMREPTVRHILWRLRGKA